MSFVHIKAEILTSESSLIKWRHLCAERASSVRHFHSHILQHVSVIDSDMSMWEFRVIWEIKGKYYLPTLEHNHPKHTHARQMKAAFNKCIRCVVEVPLSLCLYALFEGNSM